MTLVGKALLDHTIVGVKSTSTAINTLPTHTMQCCDRTLDNYKYLVSIGAHIIEKLSC